MQYIWANVELVPWFSPLAVSQTYDKYNTGISRDRVQNILRIIHAFVPSNTNKPFEPELRRTEHSREGELGTRVPMFICKREYEMSIRSQLLPVYPVYTLSECHLANRKHYWTHH